MKAFLSLSVPVLCFILSASGVETPYRYLDLDSVASGRPVELMPCECPSEKGWGDEFKTTKLLLRRIDSPSKPYYIGVFELTQKQYELITGSQSGYEFGEMRPADCLSFVKVRGGDEIEATSLLGVLRAKTGLAFDLPSEEEWEYACRAGTTSPWNRSDVSMDRLGRYAGNGGLESQHTVVGSYEPNAWGLYDFHGNVWEWCRGRYKTYPESIRALRGGAWNSSADRCRSSVSYPVESVFGYIGFGVRLYLPEEGSEK